MKSWLLPLEQHSSQASLHKKAPLQLLQRGFLMLTNQVANRSSGLVRAGEVYAAFRGLTR